MASLVTPSAKAHERVTGRWVRDLDVQTSKEWLVYYAKLIVGSPIPWLMWAYTCLTFLSRAGLEMAAWACAFLTLIYILADRFSDKPEFRFFRMGSDFFLLGYVIVGIFASINAFNSESVTAGLATLGGVRWVLLLYLIAYCLELFPGLNRLYLLLVSTAALGSIYGIWQHFTGVDLLRGEALANAPVDGHVYFIATSFFSTPEILGTLLAMVLPFPVAAFLLADERDSAWGRWFSLAISLLLAVGILWTYRTGLWVSALVGVAGALLLQARQVITYLAVTAVFIVGVMLLSYTSTDAMLTSVQDGEIARSDRQRAQINTQVELWQQNIWIGVGRKALEAANYDPGTGNVYFQILAQTGVLGTAFYFLFVLGFLLTTYRLFYEIPQSHYWHRVLVSGALASQMAFHVAGLYWATHTESLVLYLFVLVIASIAYVIAHYNHGLVPDDQAL